MSKLEGKKVVVCDYPSKYLFPPKDYGGIERWLWTVARESVELGMQVILLGPQWRSDLLPQAKHFPDRIIDLSAKEFLKKISRVDFFVGGHEYWLNDNLIKKFELIANYSMTYQHRFEPKYQGAVFDNKKNFLFCYSDEYRRIFKKQKPTKILCVAEGYNENPFHELSRGYLVSIGRIDEDKSQHFAVLAAKKLNLPIYIIGQAVRQPGYIKIFRNLFNMPHVKMLGLLSGKEKMKIIAQASCGVYTISRHYSEPAAGTIAEIIRSGVPLAGITWKKDDAVCEPINIDFKLGKIAYCNKKLDTDKKVAEKLALAIKHCLGLNRDYIYKKGNEIFNPNKLVKEMYLRILK